MGRHSSAPVALPVVIGVIASFGCAHALSESDSLQSWNEGAAKAAIVEFVQSVIDQQSADYVPPAARIAVFDNDGTLWAEQPMYTQLAFAIDRVKALAPQHPEWNETEPFKNILAGDASAALAGGNEALVELVMATHAGMTTDEFERVVTDWITTARHPTTGRLYTEMIYQPMVELLEYLRENGFKTYIISGGGVEFMRPWTEATYGIPPEQVVGSTISTEFAMTSDGPVLKRLPEIEFINDKEGKPVAINRFIGRRPIFAAGNSDGDLQMLQYTTGGDGSRFGLIVHHTDAQREWAYDRESHIGKLDKTLDEAAANGWTIVDMAQDWRSIHPIE